MLLILDIFKYLFNTIFIKIKIQPTHKKFTLKFTSYQKKRRKKSRRERDRKQVSKKYSPILEHNRRLNR